MKNALKIAVIAAMAFPLMAVSADAAAGNKKQNNFYKTSLTGNIYVQEGDDIGKERFKTNDAIEAILIAIGRDGDWRAKDCEIVMEFDNDDEAVENIRWWIYHKVRGETHKASIDAYIGLEGNDVSVVKRKWTVKNDNVKATWQLSYVDFWFDAGGWVIDALVEGKADVGVKGMKTIPFLNQVKLRTAGPLATDWDEPGKMDVKVKGRISNEDMWDAQDVTLV